MGCRELAGDHAKKRMCELECIIKKERRSLSETFRLFDLIRKITTDHIAITRITREVIEDFAAENIIYVELRTTPKNKPAVEMTKRSYMEAVMAGLDMAITSPNSIYVRLLLSIDRREGVEAAMDTVRLACEMREEGRQVVGVDLSGNPSIGEWQTFLPALTFARQQGLLLALHCGEVRNPEEVRSILDFRPERLGHVCCLDNTEWHMLLASGIPVEVCISSNVATLSVPSISEHHFVALYKAKHPTVICTDDPGIFSTSLSREYALAAACVDLTLEELMKLAREAIKHSFAEPELKETLEQLFDSAELALQLPLAVDSSGCGGSLRA